MVQWNLITRLYKPMDLFLWFSSFLLHTSGDTDRNGCFDTPFFTPPSFFFFSFCYVCWLSFLKSKIKKGFLASLKFFCVVVVVIRRLASLVPFSSFFFISSKAVPECTTYIWTHILLRILFCFLYQQEKKSNTPIEYSIYSCTLAVNLFFFFRCFGVIRSFIR